MLVFLGSKGVDVGPDDRVGLLLLSLFSFLLFLQFRLTCSVDVYSVILQYWYTTRLRSPLVLIVLSCLIAIKRLA